MKSKLCMEAHQIKYLVSYSTSSISQISSLCLLNYNWYGFKLSYCCLVDPQPVGIQIFDDIFLFLSFDHGCRDCDPDLIILFSYSNGWLLTIPCGIKLDIDLIHHKIVLDHDHLILKFCLFYFGWIEISCF